MESSVANLNLSTEEEDELILDDGSIQDSTAAVELCLVGRFLTDQPINFNVMKGRMANIWRPGRGVFVKDIGQGRFIFQFFHVVDLQRIIQGGPWSFNNIPLILHRLKSGEFPSSVPLNSLSFWVQIHDLPAGYITESVGRLLGNFIGNFLEYDANNSTVVWRQYMRVRVDIDVTTPLKRCKRIKKPDGTSFVVNFKYERLSTFCFICGRLGHSERFCEQLFSSTQGDLKKEWGSWLKAADKRSPTVGGEKWLRTSEGLSGDAGNCSNPVGDGEKKGKDIFDYGKSANQEPNLVNQSRGFGKALNTSNSAINSLVLRGNSVFEEDYMQSEHDQFALNDDRKRRRGDSINRDQIPTNVTNNILFLEHSQIQNT